MSRFAAHSDFLEQRSCVNQLRSSGFRISDFGFVSLGRLATRQGALKSGPKSEIRNPQIRKPCFLVSAGPPTPGSSLCR